MQGFEQPDPDRNRRRWWQISFETSLLLLAALFFGIALWFGVRALES